MAGFEKFRQHLTNTGVAAFFGRDNSRAPITSRNDVSFSERLARWTGICRIILVITGILIARGREELGRPTYEAFTFRS